MGDGDAAGLLMQECIAYKCWAMMLYLRVCGVLYQLMGMIYLLSWSEGATVYILKKDSITFNLCIKVDNCIQK